MNEVTASNFGLLIAYLVPGFTTLWGASYFSPTLRAWLGSTPENAPTIGGFLYITVASVAAGLTVSTVRWVFIDSLHHRTGIRQPRWDFSTLHEKVSAFDMLVEIHYRYYQWHSNAFVAVLFLYVCRRVSLGFWTAPLGWLDAGFFLLEVVFFAGSRDNLRKYYGRCGQLLSQT